MLKGGKQLHPFTAMFKKLTEKYQNAAMESSHLMPVLIIQRQMHKVRNMWHEWEMRGYETVDTPHYIWVEKGTVLTPKNVYEIVYQSIRNSLDFDKRRESLDNDVTNCFASQNLMKFGSTMNLHAAAHSITSENPLSVRSGYQTIRLKILFSY